MRRPPVRRDRDREGKFRWGVGMCSCRDRVLTVGSPTLTTLRVPFHPRNKLFLEHHNSAADFQYREVRFMHQLVAAERCYTQHLCHHCCIEEQRQVIITFVLRYFHICVWFPFFRIGTQRERILLRLCWILCWPHTVHLPAPESHCGVFTLLARSPHAGVMAVLHSGSMHSGGGYSLVNVQLALPFGTAP